MLIVCCGMIRSGSTLQYNLARCLVEATESGRGEGFIDDPRRDPRLRAWCWDKAWHVVKMHTVTNWMLEPQTRPNLRFFYSHRNLRDVTASAKRKFALPSAEIWRTLDEAILLHTHLENLPEARTHRYDKLIGDAAACLADMAACLGLSISSAQTLEILSACSLKKSEETISTCPEERSAEAMSVDQWSKHAGDGDAIYEDRTLLHHNHISASQGRDGTWQRDLTANELLTIDRRYGDWQTRQGYRP